MDPQTIVQVNAVILATLMGVPVTMIVASVIYKIYWSDKLFSLLSREMEFPLNVNCFEFV